MDYIIVLSFLLTSMGHEITMLIYFNKYIS